MPRILFIDDEPINHQLVSRALEPLGCQMDFASTGKDGISLARSQKPDLIITDVMMPDISDVAIQALDAAEVILMVASPDMASMRAVTAAMDTYAKLGYGKDKVRLVLNATFPRAGLPKDKIEAALGMASAITIPHFPDIFVEAINYGRPPVFHKPNEPASALLEDFALYLSKEAHKKAKPENPTEAWKRVYKRYQERKK